LKTSSAKSKGRRLQQETSKLLAEHYGMTHGVDNHFFSRGMGQSGCDIGMSPSAREACPFDIECKNQEKLNVWSSFEQAEQNTSDGRIPLLVFKRNRSPVYAMLRFEDLLWIMKQN
jgi:hypothetical protein